MSRTFDGNGLFTVSMAEMNAAPLPTTKIVVELYGWEWGSRLWQHWDETLPKLGVHGSHQHAHEVRRWLDSCRPTPTPATTTETKA
jgi:hypothetical protein